MRLEPEDTLMVLCKHVLLVYPLADCPLSAVTNTRLHLHTQKLSPGKKAHVA